jgi:hypothetical protein
MQRWQDRIGERFFIDPVVYPDLNRFRENLGLAPVTPITHWWRLKWRVACLFAEWCCPPQRDWPTNRIQTDFPLWDEPNPNSLPAEVDAFLDSGDHAVGDFRRSVWQHHFRFAEIKLRFARPMRQRQEDFGRGRSPFPYCLAHHRQPTTVSPSV